MKPRLVISGVNLVDLGPLSVFRDALESLVETRGAEYEIVALVHRRDLFAVERVTYLEFPDIKRSWLRRVWFEYVYSLSLSRKLKPAAWIAMHDMTPRVEVKHQFVYCHNPTPFYRFNLKEVRLEPKHGMFVLFYRFLYGLFLHRNAAVIVQQQWIREQFQRMYRVPNVVVARPNVPPLPALPEMVRPATASGYQFVYPAFARVFKNHELILKAVELLEQRGINGFEVMLTLDATNNRYASELFARYGRLRSVRWLGTLSRSQVYDMYRSADCLLFPSKLETWGLPISEFKATGKPMLLVHLPYAHETLGAYSEVTFFNDNDPELLADVMQQIIQGTHHWEQTQATTPKEPYAADWPSLWRLLDFS